MILSRGMICLSPFVSKITVSFDLRSISDSKGIELEVFSDIGKRIKAEKTIPDIIINVGATIFKFKPDTNLSAKY